MKSTIDAATAPRKAALFAPIRYARIWKECPIEADPRDSFFDALEAAPVLDKPVVAIKLTVERTAPALKALPRQPRAARAPRPTLRPALAA